MRAGPPEPWGARKVVFRVDGSATIGTGHVMRCLTLADALALGGTQSLFVSRNLDEGLARLVEGAGHRLHRMALGGPPPTARQRPYGEWLGTSEEHDARQTLAAVDERLGDPPLAVVVDHYGLGEVFERAIGKAGHRPILAIDDLGRRHCADLLLDATFGKNEADYAGLVPEFCRMMVGSSFALLRPDFARLRADAMARRDRAFVEGAPARNILVSMGGADPGDMTTRVLDALEPLVARYGLVLHALVGVAYPHGKRLEERAAGSDGRVRVQRDVRDMAALLSQMDLCVGAAGSSTWERCCMGLPTIKLVLADNQRVAAEKLLAVGAVAPGGSLDEPDFSAWAARYVVPLLEAPDRLRELSNVARGIADGCGTQRAVSALMDERLMGNRFDARNS